MVKMGIQVARNDKFGAGIIGENRIGNRGIRFKKREWIIADHRIGVEVAVDHVEDAKIYGKHEILRLVSAEQAIPYVQYAVLPVEKPVPFVFFHDTACQEYFRNEGAQHFSV